MESHKRQIINCKVLYPYKIWIQFRDGFEGVVDVEKFKDVHAFKEVWDLPGGFSNIRVDPCTRTITWGEEGHEADVNPVELRKMLEDEIS